jgi:ribosome biogenesis GTPase
VKGLVLRGSRNIFTVRSDGGDPSALSALGGVEFECRIKGKVLKGVDGYYNPLAPGDQVRFEVDPLHSQKGLILGLEERTRILTRFNRKGQAPQILAANVDLVCCVTTTSAPPFRPRFLDRAILQADIAGIPVVVLCNKSDLLETDPDTEVRLRDYERIGYQVLRVSACTGEGIDTLRSLMANRFSVLLGQSGVGKSSLVNALIPGIHSKVGLLNEKYDRGNHTTTMSVALELPGCENRTFIIDTPGLRHLVPDGIQGDDLILYLRDFAPLAGTCAYGLSCSHQSEPGCKILEAVAAGEIHEDRYESFLRIQDELRG